MRQPIRLVVATARVIGTGAGAQQSVQQSIETQPQAVAQQRFCGLNDFGGRMDKDGFWRQRPVLAAQPATKMGYSLRIDDVTGIDVQNPQDESGALTDRSVLASARSELKCW